MFIKDANMLGGLRLKDYEPGSVFEYRAERNTGFNGFWLVVGRDIKNRESLPDEVCEDMSTLEENNDAFFANNIFAVNLSTGESCFFNTLGLGCMRKVKAVVEID